LVYNARHICLRKRSGPAPRFWRNSHSKRRSSSSDDEEDGKFLQLGLEITKPFGPLGLIVAGYNQEKYLDLIIDACERTLDSKQTLFVAILGKSDLGKTFSDITSELESRDCTLPADGDELNLRYPLLLYSGFEIPQLQSSIRNIELLANRLPQPMMAMAVPNAMDKQISQLIEEIEGDHDTRLQQPAAP